MFVAAPQRHLRDEKLPGSISICVWRHQLRNFFNLLNSPTLVAEKEYIVLAGLQKFNISEIETFFKKRQLL